MKNLSQKIVDKLSIDLGISGSTVKKEIYLLARRYPQATQNARAQIYAQAKGQTVFRLLDKEDRQSLPSTNPPSYPTVASVTKPNKIKRKPTRKVEKNSGIRNFFQKIFNPDHFLGSINSQVIGTVLGALILAAAGLIYFHKPKPESEIDTKPVPLSITPLTTITTVPPSRPPISASETSPLIISEGESYTDKNSGVTIGVNNVFSRTNADITLTFPNKQSEEYTDIKSGRVFYYVGNKSAEYSLIVSRIDSDSVQIKIEKR